jgi:signal transduction histidine kinase
MRERAATLGGTLRIVRAPERGTLVEAAIPHARMVTQ